MNHKDIFDRLGKSTFRSRFHLKEDDQKYVYKHGIDIISKHAGEFILNRLASSNIPNDGKQTPMRGHPVFIAQHATATCCRGCIEKWYHIPANRALTKEEQEMIQSIIMTWIDKEMKDYHPDYEQLSL